MPDPEDAPNDNGAPETASDARRRGHGAARGELQQRANGVVASLIRTVFALLEEADASVCDGLAAECVRPSCAPRTPRTCGPDAA